MISRNVLITGAGSGLGRGLANYLAGCGHRLILVDRNQAGIDETLMSLADTSSCIYSGCFDVTSSTAIDGFITALDSTIDVLVNNAGIQHVSPIEEFPEERWDALLDVLLKAPFLLTKAVLPRMKQSSFGRIINIGSIHSLVGSPLKSAYVTAKHGLVGLAKVVALETGDTDVTINTVCPAYIRTPLVDKQIASLAKANNVSEEDVVNNIFLEPQPKKAFITVDEVAATIIFLMSDDARNITGQTITIDGGWTAR